MSDGNISDDVEFPEEVLKTVVKAKVEDIWTKYKKYKGKYKNKKRENHELQKMIQKLTKKK